MYLSYIICSLYTLKLDTSTDYIEYRDTESEYSYVNPV